MTHDLLKDLPEILEHLRGIIAMNSGDQVGVVADMNLVLVTPLLLVRIRLDWPHRSFEFCPNG